MRHTQHLKEQLHEAEVKLAVTQAALNDKTLELDKYKVDADSRQQKVMAVCVDDGDKGRTKQHSH